MATVARTPDAELLTRLRERDRAAWEELYAAYQPRLRGFAFRLAGNVHDADDLVQETFVRAVPRLDKLDPETADVGAYLFTTMRNLYFKQVEREKRAQPVAEVPEPSLPAPIEDDPVRSTLLQGQQEEVRAANARLQPRQRLVLALRELEERSYAEIGELVGMKANAVAQLIFRARESLRAELRLVQVDPDRLPGACRAYLPLLAAHLDGQLKGAKRDETLAHLEGCERCQASLEDMREASRRYRILLPPIAADESRAAIDERLTSAGYWNTGWRRLVARSPAKIAALTVVVLLVGSMGTGLGVALSGGPRPTSAPLLKPPAVEPTTEQPATGTTQPTGTTEPAATTTATPPATETTQPTETTAPAKTVTEPAATEQETEQEPEPATTEPPADTTAPVVRITKGPPPKTTSATARIAFAADDEDVTFACTLDQGEPVPCASPVSLAGLTAGAHTFSVRATDEAGNVSKPASVSWTYTPPDTTPPVVTIDSAPPIAGPRSDATFAFSANEPATFACSLDRAAFAPCTSPVTFQRLPAGTHVFSVRATDPAGNTGTASHTWTIGAPLPDLVITAFSRFSITIANQGGAIAGPSVLTITNVGTFKVPSIAPGATVTFSWRTCQEAVYTAVVDATQAVAESNEKNNAATLKNTCTR